MHASGAVLSGALSVLLLPTLLGGSQQTANADLLLGSWSGIMILGEKQGPMKLSITKDGDTYRATYSGLPIFSGPLEGLIVRPGKEPATITMRAASKAHTETVGNTARLRFALLRSVGAPQLHGWVTLDRDYGEDSDFKVVLEQTPCCHGGCVLKENCQKN